MYAAKGTGTGAWYEAMAVGTVLCAVPFDVTCMHVRKRVARLDSCSCIPFIALHTACDIKHNLVYRLNALAVFIIFFF